MISAIHIDRWEGVRAVGNLVEHPSWSVCQEAIRALDQGERTMVVLDAANGDHLSIGGGSGRYHVEITTSDERFLTLDGQADGKESVVVGGQLGIFEARQVVGLEDAVSIAEFFFEHEKPHTGYTWEES